MVPFLSTEWIAEIDRLLRAAAAPPDDSTAVIEQEITSGDSAVTYHVEVGPTGCHAALGPADNPTIRYRQSRETALAIAQQVRTAHEAFMLGDLRVEGDPSKLVEALPAMEWLDQVLAPLRDVTSFD